MNRSDHLLWNLAEECAEVAQRVSKAARFGLSEIQPGQTFTNAERIMHEWADACGAIEKMIEEGIVAWPADFSDRVAAKKSRFEKYLEISRKQGTLDKEFKHGLDRACGHGGDPYAPCFECGEECY